MNHDKQSFCEGLVKYRNYLFESSGAYQQKSYIIKYDLRTGQIIRKYIFPDKNDFAEGITIMNKEVICVMWKTEKIYYFDFELKLKRINNFLLTTSFLSTSFYSQIINFFTKQKTICWGLTNNRKSLIMTNGSNQIQFICPKTFAVTNTIVVAYDKLNAICYKRGFIYANIWCKNKIVKICAKTGTVVNEFDFTYLVEKENNTNPEFCLNGITYSEKQFLITGKCWNNIYLVDL